MRSWIWKHFINCEVLNNFSYSVVASSIDLQNWQDIKSTQIFPLPFYSWFAPLYPAHQQQNKDDTCYSFIQGSLQHSPNLTVPSYLPQGLCKTRTQRGSEKGVLLAGPTLCFLLMLFSLPGMVHRTPPSSTPASKSLQSYSCHSSPFLNLKTIFSFFDSAY